MRKYLLLTLVLCVLAWMLSVACGDIQIDDTDETSLSTNTQQLGETNSEPSTTSEEKDRTQRASDFIESLREYMIDDTVDDIVIKWNYTDNIRRFYGNGLAISLSRMGCGYQDVEESISCFLSKYQNVFGIDSQSLSDLRVKRIHAMHSGSTMYRYDQHVDSYKVPGSSVIVIVNNNGDLTQIISRFVAGLDLELGQYASLDLLYEDVNLGDLYASVSNQLGIDSGRFEPAAPIIYVDKAQKSNVGVPAFSIVTKSIRPIEIIVDANDGSVIQINKIYGEYEASSVIKTSIAYPNIGGTCTFLCGTPRICSSEFTPDKHCVDRCNGDGPGEENGDDECENEHGDSWQCWSTEDDEEQYLYWCYNKLDDPTKDPDVEIYNDGWQISQYQYYPRMANLQETVEDVRSYWDTRNIRDGLDGEGKDLVATISAHCMEWDECEEEPCQYTYGEGCAPAIAWGGSDEIWLHVGGMALFDDGDPEYHQWNIIGHEFGHSIVGNECNNQLLVGNDCLGESLAQFHAKFFVVYKTNNNIYWADERTGLQDGVSDWGLPYALRSRFDWLACSPAGGTGNYCTWYGQCEPYEVCNTDTNECYVAYSKYHNWPIWGRFGRVLSDGPGVLNVYPHYEDVGYSFSGISLDSSEHIFIDAYNMLDSGDYPNDWVDNLLQAGSDNGQLDKTRMSLGIVGFITRTDNPTSPTNTKTIYAPNEYVFSSYNQSTNKRFTAWKEWLNNNIRVRYNTGTSWYNDTIYANAAAGPAMVEYNSKLYVFWTDNTTRNIKFLYYNSNATKSSIYDLGSKDIKSNKAFDAIVFGGDLHIVYDYKSTQKISLSKCTTTTCTGSGWHDFDSGAPTVYRKELSQSARVGTIGVDAGTDLNGVASSGTEYLYIVSSVYGGADNRRIRIQQLNSSYSVTHSTMIPTYYPSYKTEKEIGVRMAESAFPAESEVPGNNYLYIAWKEYSSSKLYKAVVQYFDDGDDSDTWITKSDYMYLDGTTGMRIRKGEEIDQHITTYLHTNANGYIKYSTLYGRY